ncbi:MAG TPA: iron-only hydrogenase system regulator [Bacillota bacterium]|jgi:putative iron-only hydrogenase system regulator|nr:iron-only hydrogenase system regulator [Bacillota bacterium]
MDTRVAVIGIIVEQPDSVEEMNHLLTQYGNYIIGRMGVPYEKKQISVISVVLDAPQDIISALSGKLGALPGISTKTIYSKA